MSSVAQLGFSSLTGCTLGADAKQRPSRLLTIMLAGYALSLPFSASMLFAIPAWHFGVAPFYLCGAGWLLAGLWLIGREGWAPQIVRHVWAVPAYVLMSLLSIALTAALPLDQLPIGGDKHPWIFGVTQWMYLAWTLGGTLVLSTLLRRNPSALRPLLRAHILVAMVVSLWGWYQCVGFAFAWPYPTWFNNNPFRHQNYEQVFAGLRRISSTTPEPADFAMYLLSVVPLLLLTGGGKGLLPRYWGWLALVICTLTLCLTTSLSAYLGLLLIAIWGFGNLRRLRWQALLAILLLCAMAVAGIEVAANLGSSSTSLLAGVEQRVATSSSRPDASLEERSQSLAIAAAIVRDHPLIGVGEGNYAFAAYQHHAPGAGYQIPRVFSLGARILCEHGTLGAALFVLLMLQFLQQPATVVGDPALLAGLRCSFAVGTSVMLVSSADIDHYSLWMVAAVLLAMTPLCRPSSATPGAMA